MKKILIFILVIILAGLIFVTLSKSDKPSDETNLPNNKNEKEQVVDLSLVEKPASFANIPMITYKSAEYGYEITYPEEWTGTLVPNIFGDRVLEVYYLHPVEIPYGPPSLFDIKFRLGTTESFIDDMVDIYNLKPIKLNSLEGYQFDIEEDEIKRYYILKVDNNRFISVLYWPNEEYNTTEEGALWVLSTLKLTDN